MSEPDEQVTDEQAAEPIGWQVLGPDGEVVDSGPQVALTAASDAGETGDLDGSY